MSLWRKVQRDLTDPESGLPLAVYDSDSDSLRQARMSRDVSEPGANSVTDGDSESYMQWQGFPTAGGIAPAPPAVVLLG